MKNCFTLAEVLITLTIIGVVSAMTISQLVQTTSEQEYVSRLKKAYSILTQVYTRQKAEGLLPDEWGFTTSDSKAMIDKILPYISYTKVCYGSEAQCHKGKLYSKSGKNIFSSKNTVFGGQQQRNGVILSDGIMIGSYVISGTCTNKIGTSKILQHQCGEYMVDVNGEKKPNKYGKDIFIFMLTLDGIVPTGLPDYENSSDSWSYSFNEGCLASDAKGGGCTAWVLQHSNLDYLHCPDKIKKGATSCK